MKLTRSRAIETLALIAIVLLSALALALCGCVARSSWVPPAGSTLTDAVTWAVSGPPIAGANATITRSWIATFGTLEATVVSPGAGVGIFGADPHFVVRSTSNDCEWIVLVNAMAGYMGTMTNHPLKIYTNNAERLEVAATTLTFADALNMVFNATTGTKIGTAGSQKLAFYGATPIIQQTGVAVSAAGIHAALVNLGLITA